MVIDTNRRYKIESACVKGQAFDGRLVPDIEIGAGLQHSTRRITPCRRLEIPSTQPQEITLAATDIQPRQCLRVYSAPGEKIRNDPQFSLEEKRTTGRKFFSNRILH